MAIVVLTNTHSDNPNEILSTAFKAANPEIVAAYSQVSAGEDRTLSNRLRTFFTELLHGTVDRSQMSDAYSKHLTPDHVQRADAQLAPFGSLESFTYKGRSASGSTTVYTYLLHFSKGDLQADFSLDGSGKISALALSAE